jgi:hypothetical protein
MPVSAIQLIRADGRFQIGSMCAPFFENQGREIADKDRYCYGRRTQLRAIDSICISFQSGAAPISIHAAGFAMLSLAPVMDLDVSS